MKIGNIIKLIKALPASIRLNLRFLPFKQAIKLPIIIYNADLSRMGHGEIIINAPIKFGMIRLGLRSVSIYPPNKYVIENKGRINFNGTCSFGHGGAISIGENGLLEIGNHVGGTYGNKIVCYNHIAIGDNTLIGWETMICDSDFHRLKSTSSNEKIGNISGEITIGANCWIAAECRLLKNAKIPSKTTVGFGSFIHSPVNVDEGCVIASETKISVIATNRYLDRADNS